MLGKHFTSLLLSPLQMLMLIVGLFVHFVLFKAEAATMFCKRVLDFQKDMTNFRQLLYIFCTFLCIKFNSDMIRKKC